MKKIMISLCVICLANGLKAETIQGQVVDPNQRPIVDALIYFNEGENPCHSDLLGRFNCDNVAEGDVLNVRYLGFKTFTKTMSVNDFEKGLLVELSEDNFQLEQVVVSNSMKSLSRTTSIDMNTHPVKSAQDLLRRVPGLFVAQHAGGGKAEQIFLRGFDIDHGTDIRISVDGLPVNMVSHAHGQGYADLHFLIPEIVEDIDFGKGPYFADQGDFNTAGYVEFKTKDKLNESLVAIEHGSFGTFRTLGLFDLFESSKQNNAYLGAEFVRGDGPFEHPQDLNRINLIAKYSHQFKNDDGFSVLASRMESQWNASGQIPQRAVDRGIISRFGRIDDIEGGETSRTNFLVDYSKTIGNNMFLKSKAYWVNYDFELFSNFTFFRDDPINGDRIRQKESRNIFGLESHLYQNVSFGRSLLEMKYGLGLRSDIIVGNELSHIVDRSNTLERFVFGDVNESNWFGFIDARLDLGNWIINPSLRVDYLGFTYRDLAGSSPVRQSRNQTVISPKFNILFSPTRQLQLYVKSGIGFHSNDARVVVTQNGKEALPKARGLDVGAIWKPIPRLWVNGALWSLDLDQEFVYVGDAGIVEPNGKSSRKGLDFGLRFQLTTPLFFDADVNYTYARSSEEKKGNNFIPLSPDFTVSGGISYQGKEGWKGGFRYRFMKDRPANEDNSLLAQGYFIADMNVSYSLDKFTLGVFVENIFDSEWNETQFATESRLRDELESVEEIHFTPGTPFFTKFKVSYSF